MAGAAKFERPEERWGRGDAGCGIAARFTGDRERAGADGGEYSGDFAERDTEAGWSFYGVEGWRDAFGTDCLGGPDSNRK